MALPQLAFFREGVGYLNEVITGEVFTSCKELKRFTGQMRELFYSHKKTDECLAQLLEPSNKGLSLDRSEREKMSDWRFNPSLVVPLLEALADVRNSASRIECIHSIGLLLETAAGIERNAIGQKYPRENVNIVIAIKAFKSYDELMSPIKSALVSLALHNTGSYQIDIASEAFVAADTPSQENCTASTIALLLSERKLKVDAPDVSYGPLSIQFKNGGVLYTTNPYLALIYAICESIIRALATGSVDVDDLQQQLTIAKQWLSAMSVSILLPVQVSADFFVRRAEMFLGVFARRMSLSSLIRSEESGILLNDQNPIYSLVAAALVQHKLREAMDEPRLTLREDIMLHARRLTAHLSQCDLQLKRTAVTMIDKQFPSSQTSVKKAGSVIETKVPISLNDVIVTLEEFYLA